MAYISHIPFIAVLLQPIQLFLFASISLQWSGKVHTAELKSPDNVPKFRVIYERRFMVET